MAKEGYGTVLELLRAPVDLQGLMRAMFLHDSALEVRRSIYDDSIDDQKAEAAKARAGAGVRY